LTRSFPAKTFAPGAGTAGTPKTPLIPGEIAPPEGPAACDDQAARLIDRMADKMRTLAEDVRAEVPDARGRALAARACGLREQIGHMRREARVASPRHLREEAAELDRGFHEFIEAAEALGPRGRYLARAAERVEDLDHELLRLLDGPPRPVAVPPCLVAPPTCAPPPPIRIIRGG
jgi:hypothetical protein